MPKTENFHFPPTQDGLLPAVESFLSHGSGQGKSNGDGMLRSLDPANGKTIGLVKDFSEKSVDEAVEAAHRAFLGSWRATSPFAREHLMHRLADLIEANKEELAQYDALESGKPAKQVEAIDIALAVEQFRYYAGWPSKIQGAVIPVEPRSHLVYTRKDPVGVIAAITPWNFPLCQAAIKIAPALAAGNTVVLKPSELTSLSTLRLAELALEAGFPEGVITVVTGAGLTAGSSLVAHPLVRGITFTGSSEVGRKIASGAGESLKRVSLELGGKNAHIILPDADVASAAGAAATTAFFYSGQVCFAGSRLMVHSSIRDEVMDVLHSYADKLVVGPSMSPESSMGPLVSSQHREKVSGLVDRARAEDGDITRGGHSLEDSYPDGFFYAPTIVFNPDDHASVTREEIFGPVLVVQTFDDDDDLVARANSTAYGLTAGLWTSDLARAHSLADRLDVGTVWVNTYTNFAASVPWGGVKNSGLGGKDCGPDGVEKFLETKTIWVAQ